MTAGLTVLHVSPHPDDEMIGAGATLMELRDFGHRVVNLACGLGRPADRGRRRAELEEACGQAGFELLVHDPPLEISVADDLAVARRTLADSLARLIPKLDAAILVSPSPHDGHHGHEVVARAVTDALGAIHGPPPRWWIWGLWADLPLPTLVTLYDERRMEELLAALAAYRGEVVRNDYPGLVRARATVNRVLGAEKVFGTGAPGFDAPFADLLTETLPAVERPWHAAGPRVLDPRDPLGGAEAGAPIDWWLDAPGFKDRMSRPARRILDTRP
jgi:LmbE family N-acetylglucosaminyl deacetylase